MSKTPANNENLFPELPAESDLPENIDRRTFIIRNAVIGAAAAMTGTTAAVTTTTATITRMLVTVRYSRIESARPFECA